MSASPPAPSPPVSGAATSRSFSSVEAIRSSTSWAWIPSLVPGRIWRGKRESSLSLADSGFWSIGGQGGRVNANDAPLESRAMDARAAASQVKEWAHEAGFDRCGIASLQPLEHGGAFVRWLERGEHAG